MQIFESRWGVLFLIIYALISIASVLLAFSCGDVSCLAWGIVPVLPWAVILQNLGLSLTFATYPLIILGNSVLVYLLGVLVELLIIQKPTTRAERKRAKRSQYR